jgi:predicted MPP superfamily phosphohydrolase
VLERVEIACGSTPIASGSLRVGFVTDTHIGPACRAADVAKAMTLLAEASFDLLLFGGDFVCESPRFIPEAAAVFRSYAALPRYGAFAVFGNHDYANDAPRLEKSLDRIGIRVLRNEGVTVCARHRPYWIAGVDDAVLGRPDPELAFTNRPADTTAIALWHEPDWAEQTATMGASLQLSGHSHGGQILLPIIGHVAAPFGGRRFVAGLNEVAGMLVYTSRGVGVYRPPVRFRCRPEVTIITIRSDGDDER